MLNLLEIVQRPNPPTAWAEGEKIPWNDPDFSARMLNEHLSQAHDAASRRAAIITRHVAWIHIHLLGGKASSVLDLGCGPGLYANHLAALGHTCTGIDFSPASIAYARQQSATHHLSSTYQQADLRDADYGSGHTLVMFIYGEFNVFTTEDIRRVLGKAHAALKPGGMLLLEPHTFAAVREIGQQPASWYSAGSGLFSAAPYLLLEECFWDETRQVATERYYVIDAASGAVTRHASSMQAYGDDAYRALLRDCGFSDITFYPTLGDVEPQPGLFAITARKAG